MLFSLGAGVYAGANLQEIKAYLNGDIKIKYNGAPAQLLDEQGQALLPITYNDSTYLPVRAISNIVKTAIQYDEATDTIYLGERQDGIPLANGFDSDFHSKDPKVTVYKGKDYKDVFFNNYAARRSAGFVVYPKGKYQTLHLETAATGFDIEKVAVEDSDRDITLKSFSLSPDEGLKSVDIDIAGVNSLYIHAEGLEEGGGWFIPLTTSYYK